MKFYEDKFKKTKSKKFVFYLLFPFFYILGGKKLVLFSLFRMKSKLNAYPLSDFELKIGDVSHPVKFIPLFYSVDKKKRKHLAFMKIVISLDDLSKFEKHSVVYLHRNENSSIVFNWFDKSYKRRKSVALRDKENGTITVFRQSISGKMILTTQIATHTDTFKGKTKVFFASIFAKIANLFSRKKPILMYEKFAMRYEEGGSIFFQYLIDQGYKNVFFVADSSYVPADLDEKYKSHIIERLSFKHYLYYFRTDTFISSETNLHSLEYNNLSFAVWKHFKRGEDKVRHIHLQHGVMYMLSLANPKLSGSRKSTHKGLFKEMYVVSSYKEALHFIECGGYDWDDLLVTGIPKFDKSYTNPGADKIVIMPTWRPWEENTAVLDPENSTYYGFIMKIKDAVPDNLKDKIIILPHPMFNTLIRKQSDTGDNMTYDEILRDTKLLITDYSSISYDAFYRGCNVIFDWSELELCMQSYGSNSRIMLKEKEAFGYVTYEEGSALTELIEKSYNEPQDKTHIKKYRRIVEYYDNNNCGRLLEELQKQNIL